MIEIDNFTFSSAPKTGCRWMRGFFDKYFDVIDHDNLHKPKIIKGKAAIANVRHPAKWLRSYYQNIRQLINHAPVDQFQRLLTDLEYQKGRLRTDRDDFIKFVTRYLSLPENTIYDMYYSYPADYRFPVEKYPHIIKELFDLSYTNINHYPTPDTFSVPEEIT